MRRIALSTIWKTDDSILLTAKGITVISNLFVLIEEENSYSITAITHNSRHCRSLYLPGKFPLMQASRPIAGLIAQKDKDTIRILVLLCFFSKTTQKETENKVRTGQNR